MYTLDIFKEGNSISCSQCKRKMTVQFDEMAPTGWWTLFDYKKQLSVFCSLVCMMKFLSKYDTISVQGLDRVSTFGTLGE